VPGASHAGQAAPAQPEHKHSGPTAAQIAAAAHAAAIKGNGPHAVGADGHPHAFPEDAGPWAGDDSPIEDKEHDGTADAEHVELESDVSDVAAREVESAGSSDAEQAGSATEVPEAAPVGDGATADGASGVTEVGTATTPDARGGAADAERAEAAASDAPEPAAQQDAEPPARGRRRRGRVVAPAGPPRSSSASPDATGPAREHHGV
jgi:ribonuclease E